MNKTIFIIGFIFLITCSKANSIEPNIIGKWILTGSYDCKGNYEKNNSSQRLVYMFKEDGKVDIIKSSKIISEQTYSIENSQLMLDFNDYQFEFMNDDTLFLTQSDENSCLKFILISSNVLNAKQKEKFFISASDTIYFPVSENSPILKDNESYQNYFISNCTMRFLDKETECKVRIQFIVDRNGNIVKPVVWNSCNEKYNKFLLKLIDKTEDKWTPLFLFNKPVDCFIKVEFTYRFGTT